MTDLVDIFRGYAEGLGWLFSYGNSANRNLIVSNLIVEQKYFLLDTITRSKSNSEFGGTGEITFSGSFMLVVKSDLDNVYDNQKQQDRIKGKYTKNIKPLLETDLVLFENLVNCSQYEITSWSIVDAVNALDLNTDGVVVTFTVKTL